MKNQIEEPIRGAPDAAPHEPDAFEAAWLDYNKAGVAGGWEKVAFVGGFGRGFKAGRESGHVVLLEALKKLREWDKKWPKRAYIVEYGMISQSERELNEICELAEAAIQQAERGQ